MREQKILLKSIDDVKNFVRIVSEFHTDVDIVGGRYVIDAKSILGLFSLDLTNPVLMRIADDSEADVLLDSLGDIVLTT